jgi:hypothetical protein
VEIPEAGDPGLPLDALAYPVMVIGHVVQLLNQASDGKERGLSRKDTEIGAVFPSGRDDGPSTRDET